MAPQSSVLTTRPWKYVVVGRLLRQITAYMIAMTAVIRGCFFKKLMYRLNMIIVSFIIVSEPFFLFFTPSLPCAASQETHT